MLKYALATTLKEAGFPQGVGNYACQCGESIIVTDGKTAWCKCGELAYTPTLSELIEACGEKFKGLEKLTDTIWGAYISSDEAPENSLGHSPEEAVAYLWLALHNHKNGDSKATEGT